jgi:hypothetical protein
MYNQQQNYGEDAWSVELIYGEPPAFNTLSQKVIYIQGLLHQALDISLISVNLTTKSLITILESKGRIGYLGRKTSFTALGPISSTVIVDLIEPGDGH